MDPWLLAVSLPMVMVPPPLSLLEDEVLGEAPVVVVSLLLLEQAAPIRTTATSTTTDRHNVDRMPSLLVDERALRTERDGYYGWGPGLAWIAC